MKRRFFILEKSLANESRLTYKAAQQLAVNRTTAEKSYFVAELTEEVFMPRETVKVKKN